MEFWNNGMMEKWAQKKNQSFLSPTFSQYSNLPLFQYSLFIPAFHLSLDRIDR
jgi:hypothetical protein